MCARCCSLRSYFLDLKTLPPVATAVESPANFVVGACFSLTPATRFSFRLPLLPTPTTPLFNPEVITAVVAFALVCGAFVPRVSAEFSRLLPELVAAVSVDERAVARDEGLLESETGKTSEGIIFRTIRVVLVVALMPALMVGLTIIVFGGDEKVVGELDVGGRLDFEGDNARGRDVFATAGIGGGGGGICSRAEATAVFLVLLFLGMTRRAD